MKTTISMPCLPGKKESLIPRQAKPASEKISIKDFRINFLKLKDSPEPVLIYSHDQLVGTYVSYAHLGIPDSYTAAPKPPPPAPELLIYCYHGNKIESCPMCPLASVACLGNLHRFP